jgi:hypothetical protein
VIDVCIGVSDVICKNIADCFTRPVGGRCKGGLL